MSVSDEDDNQNIINLTDRQWNNRQIYVLSEKNSLNSKLYS
jgi:hypothetical protein